MNFFTIYLPEKNFYSKGNFLCLLFPLFLGSYGTNQKRGGDFENRIEGSITKVIPHHYVHYHPWALYPALLFLTPF